MPDHSIRAVFCAQSFHWFAEQATLAEIERILQPDGDLVLIWNQRDINTDWVKALAEILAAGRRHAALPQRPVAKSL